MPIRSALAAAALALVAQAPHAQTFVGGIPSGWQCDGICGTLGADGDVKLAPTAAAKYGYVVTNTEQPEGVSPFSIGNEKTGARLRSTSFDAKAGDSLQFYFNFITSDGTDTYSDYAWARLLKASDLSQVALLFTAQTQESGSIVPAPGLPPTQATLAPPSVPIISKPVAPGDQPGFGDGPVWSPLADYSSDCFDVGCGYTGWVQSSFAIASAGSYVLEFGVVNYEDILYQSGLAFDGITVGGVPVVPEPHTDALFATGLAALAWMRRRRLQRG